MRYHSLSIFFIYQNLKHQVKNFAYSVWLILNSIHTRQRNNVIAILEVRMQKHTKQS